MRLKPSIFPILCALLGAGNAAALGLGQITVLSHLGTRLHAEVELLGAPAGSQPIAECFRLTQPNDVDAAIPVLSKGRVTFERQNGKPRLLISSDQFINDPVLQLSVRAGCGAEVARDYILIIDPAEEKPAKPAAAIASVSKPPLALERAAPASNSYPEHWQTGTGESALSIAQKLFPRQPSAQRRFLQALQTANPDLDLGPRGDLALVAGTQLNIPDTRRQPAVASQAKIDAPTAAEPAPVAKKEKPLPPPARAANGRMSDRLSISGGAVEAEVRPDGLPLRLSTELSLKTLSRTTDKQRTILRLEYQLLAAIYDQASQQLSIAEQVRQLESSVAELQAASENSIRPAPLAETPAPTGSTPDAAPVVKEIVAPSPAARRARNDTRADDTGGWIGLAVLLGVLASLIWWLRRRTLKSAVPLSRLTPEDLPPEEALPWALSDEAAPAVALKNERPTHPTPPLYGAITPAHTLPPRQPAPLAAPVATVLTEHYEFNPVMELADIMLSFGRIKGATDALLEYIEQSPNEALQPWIKLLEIYRQGGMRGDYDALSQKLKLHFNVAPVDWDAMPVPALQQAEFGDEDAVSLETLLARLPNIARIAHVSQEITRTWDTPAGHAYLNKLLRDNRQGERQGFTLATVSELLFLLDTLEKRLKKEKIPD